MQPELSNFVQAAMAIGVADRLVSLRADVEKAIANYPPGDTRYLTRLERQHERLQNPDLELIVRLVTTLCVEDPSRLATVAPIAQSLKARFPPLAPLATPTALS